MPCRGNFFALTAEEAGPLLAADGDAAVRAARETIEKRRDEPWLVRVDQSWDAMHRCLSNGTLYYDEGEYPLNRTVMGGKHLTDGDDVVVAYVAPHEVKDVAAALAPITQEDFRKRYDAIDPDEYDGEHGDADFLATWGHLQAVRDLYKRAAEAGRSVVFTVDQ